LRRRVLRVLAVVRQQLVWRAAARRLATAARARATRRLPHRSLPCLWPLRSLLLLLQLLLLLLLLLC
jgi:hypothetical protein